MHTTELYFEAHVTIEPVFGHLLDVAETIARRHRFRVAELMMMKRPVMQDDKHARLVQPERSPYDTFMTGRGTDYNDLNDRMLRLVAALRLRGIAVWRYKLENTLLDVRCAK